jgi:quinol monooxygenase YgiN
VDFKSRQKGARQSNSQPLRVAPDIAASLDIVRPQSERWQFRVGMSVDNNREESNLATAETRHIICTVRALPQHRQRVKEILLELIEPARAEPGCLYYNLQQQEDQPDTFHIVDGWVDMGAVAEHRAHPNVLRVVELLEPLLVAPLKSTISVRISD